MKTRALEWYITHFTFGKTFPLESEWEASFSGTFINLSTGDWVWEGKFKRCHLEEIDIMETRLHFQNPCLNAISHFHFWWFINNRWDYLPDFAVSSVSLRLDWRHFSTGMLDRTTCWGKPWKKSFVWLLFLSMESQKRATVLIIYSRTNSKKIRH